jgi:hypothetical protein
MPGFLKAAAIVMSGGAIVSAGALEMMPEDARPSVPLFATAPFPDFAPVSCKQQFWLNADRACQTWTVPHREVKRVLLVEPSPPANAARNTAQPVPDERPAAEATATTPTQAQHTAENADNKARSVRSARSATASPASAAPSRAADARRVITSRAAMESSL